MTKKPTIAVPDALMARVDDAALSLGESRSKFFVQAVLDRLAALEGSGHVKAVPVDPEKCDECGLLGGYHFRKCSHYVPGAAKGGLGE